MSENLATEKPEDQQQTSEQALVEQETVEEQAISDLEEEIIVALKTVYDPEIPVDIYELGLIYQIDIDEDAQHVDVEMTLTAPGCPVAEIMPSWVQDAVESVDGVKTAGIEMVWDPPWTPDRMSMRAKIELNMF